MRLPRRHRFSAFASLTGLIALAFGNSANAADQTYRFDIPAEPLGQALVDFSRTSSQEIFFSEDEAAGKSTTELHGQYTIADALQALLVHTDLTVDVNPAGVILVLPKDIERLGNCTMWNFSREHSVLLTGVSAMALSLCTSLAWAQDTETVNVTASRVIRPGFEAPTPTTVLSSDDIYRAGNSNLVDTLNDLPALTGSGSPQQSAASGNYVGQAFVSLRGLGAQRTLFLVDGQRYTPTNYFGATSVNIIPQAEVQRVEVVTGGASAQWGSDAIAGVVNIVLNHDLEGIKGSIQGGTTDYGDYQNYRISVAAGHTFAGGRAHLEIAGEVADNNGVGPLSRGWLRAGYSTIPNPNSQKTPAQPANLIVPNVRLSAASYGGVITSGPLKGIQFGPGGIPAPFTYGTDVSASYMIGGDGVPVDAMAKVAPPVSRQAGYARFSYDITPDVQFYVSADLGHSLTKAPLTLAGSTYDTYTIKSDNAFLPASIKTAMAANKITSFSMGRWSSDYAMNVIHFDVETLQVSGGLKGSFGDGWTWNVDYGYGGTNNPIKTFNNRNKANYALAVDSVIDPRTGAAACRSTLTSPTNGCVPLNPFGPGSVSQSAIDYINGTSLKTFDMRRATGAATLNGTPFSTWAGPVSFATGFEYRHDSVNVTSDPIAAASGWSVSSQVPFAGATTVIEGFGEFVIPLATNEWWAKDLILDLAARETGYSLTGVITTWKAGVDYAINDDIRLRANRSRDYRQPDLNSLFQGGSSANSKITDNSTNPATVYPSIYTPGTGNPDLKPETSDTTTLGFVATPHFLPNFEMSVDYYDIQMANALVAVSAQNVVNYCNEVGILCDLITRDSSGAITQVKATRGNAQSARRSGIDIEAIYKIPDGEFGWNEGFGNLTLHYTGTWLALDSSSLPGAATVRTANVVGSPATAGLSFGGGPRWHFNLAAIWDRGPYQVGVTGRYVGGGDLFSAPTTAASYNILKTSNRFYTDLNLQYRLEDENLGSPVFFLGARNLFNLSPPTDGETSLGDVPTVVSLYDAIGRQYMAGIRFQF